MSVKESQKEALQKYGRILAGVGVISFGVYQFFAGSPSEQRMGSLAKEELSVFDQLRTDEEISLKPDPLLDPLKDQGQLALPAADAAPLAAAAQVSPDLVPPPAPSVAIPVEEKGAVSEPVKVAKAAPASECSEEKWKLGDCDAPTKKAVEPPAPRPAASGVTLASLTSSREAPPRPSRVESPRAETRVMASSGNAEMWGQLSSSVREMKGAVPEYSGPVIKAHCRVMALVMDGVRVSDSQGGGETITLNVKGPMPGCSLPDISGGLVLGADAAISPNRKWITARVSKCSDTGSRRPSRPCKAVVESITGEDGLEGQVYDQSFFGAMLEFGINAMGFVFLKDLAGSASKVENVWSASATIQIADSFQQMLAKGAAKVSEAFSGREIHLVRGAPVIVTFTEDVIL